MTEQSLVINVKRFFFLFEVFRLPVFVCLQKVVHKGYFGKGQKDEFSLKVRYLFL